MGGAPSHYPYIATEIGGYYHPRFATAVTLETGFGYRITLRSGIFFDGRVGFGYLHAFLGGPIYTTDNQPVPNYGLPGAMPLLELGFGFKLRTATRLQASPFLRLLAFGRYPFNGTTLPRVALAIGTYLRMSRSLSGKTR